jgi:hypothetical protein
MAQLPDELQQFDELTMQLLRLCGYNFHCMTNVRTNKVDLKSIKSLRDRLARDVRKRAMPRNVIDFYAAADKIMAKRECPYSYGPEVA